MSLRLTIYSSFSRLIKLSSKLYLLVNELRSFWTNKNPIDIKKINSADLKLLGYWYSPELFFGSNPKAIREEEK